MDENLKYDEPRTSEMKAFVEKMYKISVQNGEFLDDYDIYHELSKVGLKFTDLDNNHGFVNCSNLFEKWKERYQGKFNNLKVFEANRPFLEFQSNPKMTMTDEYIKMYIPVDKEPIYAAGNMIFDYIARLKVPHQSKISKRLRSDNIVLYLPRSASKEASLILDFVKNNEYIRSGLNKTNPFVPTIGGVGYILSEGDSFNHNVAFAIRDYVYFMVQEEKNEVSMDEFKLYLSSYVHDKSLVDWMYSKVEKKNLSYDQKLDVFIKCLKNTQRKYGIEHLIAALEEIINNDNYNYISNGDGTVDYRRILKEQVGKNFIFLNIKKVLLAYGLEDEFDVKKYCQFVFANKMSHELKDALYATFIKYGKEHLIMAIKQYVFKGKSSGFTRRLDGEAEEINHRETIEKFSPNACLNVMLGSLKNNGITCDGLDESDIIEIYVNNLKSNGLKM